MSEEKNKKPIGLALLREPFEPHQISKLPKQLWKNETYVSNKTKKANCDICGGFHYVDGVIHLDYVGHAALTDRLLDCDPLWNWEPMALDSKGLPLIENNQMWIKLTVCDKTVIGFGDAQGKTGANAVKEIIGDALRNAAMRMGAALNLWHKGDLHIAGALIDGETGEILEHSEPKNEPVTSKTAQSKKADAKPSNEPPFKIIEEEMIFETISEAFEWFSINYKYFANAPNKSDVEGVFLKHFKNVVALYNNIEALIEDYNMFRNVVTEQPMYKAVKPVIVKIISDKYNELKGK